MSARGNGISAIIPVFNRRREVARAIASVLRQTRPADEILIVDDASSDGSADAVADIREARIRLIRHETNRGAAAARNTGIAAAQGDWIAFLDCDDEWHGQKLERQSTALATAGTDAGVTGYVIRDYRTNEERRFIPSDRDASLDAVLWGCPLGLGSTLLARRSIFAEVGALDPALRRLEDWEWLMRYLPSHRLHVLPEALTTVHKSSDPSRNHVESAIRQIRAVHRDAWYRRSWLDGRKFDSTLLVEEAAAAHYAGANWRAGCLALRALTAYPLRPSLLQLLARRALRRRG